MYYDEDSECYVDCRDDDESDLFHIDNHDAFVNEYETTLREDLLTENPPQSIEEIRYENIVYQNTVAALLAGAELTARDGKTKWSLSHIDATGMTKDQINLEARVLASYVVGWDMTDYQQGVLDCMNNKIPQNGMSDEYYEGYGDQYAKEQQLSQGNN